MFTRNVLFVIIVSIEAIFHPEYIACGHLPRTPRATSSP